MSKPKYPVPEGIAAPGAAVWLKVSESYTLRPDELATLEDACAATDMVAALSAAWSDLGHPLVTTGSMGQEIIHPLIGEIRTQRAARNALWRQLKLPDLPATSEPAEGAPVKPNQHRAAAASKWAAAHGSTS